MWAETAYVADYRAGCSPSCPRGCVCGFVPTTEAAGCSVVAVVVAMAAAGQAAVRIVACLVGKVQYSRRGVVIVNMLYLQRGVYAAALYAQHFVC